MAIISETFHDGSDGGDPNKNPQEKEEDEENQNENPNEEDQEDAIENLPPIPRQIPQVLLIESTCVSPQELYDRRLRLGLTQPVLYALIGFPLYSFPKWYILTHNIPRNISLRLSGLSSLPPMNPGSAVVAIGYKMYVIGGHISPSTSVSTVIVIDCRFHKWDYLPNMQRARNRAAAGVIDGKIYVIGGCKKRYDDWIEVFDVENEIWSPVPDPYDYDSSLRGGDFVTYVVMQDKIYILDALRGLVYDPRQGTWQSWELGTKLMYFWRKPCCVIEDLLYSVDPRCVLRHPILVYDPNEMAWTPVKGVYGLPMLNYFECTMANFGGKLMVLGSTNNQDGYKDIWYIEIALERREGGEIWGKVDLMAPVLRCVNSPHIDLCRSVTL